MARDKRFRWDLGPELSHDRDLEPTSSELAGRGIALLITGSIASFRAPLVARALRKAGARDVVVFATPTAMQFVTPDALHWATGHEVITSLDGRAQHVELPAIDAFLVAPATYATIGKAAQGIADNAVTTTLATALGLMELGRTCVLFAPTMHGHMLNAVVRRNLGILADLGCAIVPPLGRDGKALLPDDATLVQAVAQALRVGSTAAMRRTGEV